MPEHPEDHLEAVAWAALGYVAAKQLNKAHLESQSSTPFELALEGQLGGQAWFDRLRGDLAVGAPSQRSKSQAPNQVHLIAYLLGKLNKRTQRSILLGLPGDFKAAGGELPPAEEALEKATKVMLGQLRTAVPQQVAAPISCSYELVR